MWKCIIFVYNKQKFINGVDIENIYVRNHFSYEYGSLHQRQRRKR